MNTQENEKNSGNGVLSKVLGFVGTMALALICVANPSQESSRLVTTVPSIEARNEVTGATSRGRFKVGGSAGFSRGESASSISVSPTVDVFIFDRTSIGLETAFGFYDGRMVYRSIRPAAAFYFFRGDELAMFFRQDIGFTKMSYGREYEDINLIDARTGVGLDWFLNRYVALSPSLGVEYGRDQNSRVFGDLKLSVFF